MTACTNKGGKAGRVITAALVATLSVGAPVVALATTADSGVSLFAVDGTDAFANAKLTAATDNKGNKVDVTDTIEFEVSDNLWLVPTEVTPEEDGASPVTIVTEGQDKNATISYYSDSTGTIGSEIPDFTNDASKRPAGKYWAKVEMDSNAPQYANATFSVQFSLVNNSLKGAVAFDAQGGSEDVTDTTFTYVYQSGNAVAPTLGIALDGKALGSSDWQIASGSAYVNKTTGAVLSSAPTDPGSYSVLIEGKTGSKYAGSSTWVDYTISKVDLSSAKVEVADTIVSNPDGFAVTVDGFSYDNDQFDFTITAGGSLSENGEKTYAITGKDDKFYTGSASVKINKVAAIKTKSEFKYNGTSFDTKDSADVDLTTGDPVSVTDFSVDGVANDKLSITVCDKDGNVKDASVLKTAGTWLVKVRVDAAKNDYKFGSAEYTFTVTNTNGSIASTDVVFVYDGEVCTTKTVTYDGTDKLDALKATVKDADGNVLEQGTDYTLEVTKGGSKVDEAVDADTTSYTVTIKSDYYTITGETFTLTINAIEPTDIKVSFPTAVSYIDKNGVEQSFIPYTGEEVAAPVVSYATGEKDADGEDIYAELPSDVYELTFSYDGTSSTGAFATTNAKVEKVGYYKLSDSFISKTADAKSNYDFSNVATVNGKAKATGVVFNVSKTKVFTDVDNTAWYASSIYTAAQQGYIFGVNNSNVFAPEASINRADVVCVLYRMAGGTVTDEDSVSQDKSYLTKFSDVEGNEYFAQALAWASKTGVVTGYEDGTFGAGDPVTAEQFATMLARYAKLTGTDTSVDDVDAVLGSVADGGQVSEFAREAVAWAVESGYMAQGSDIVPQSEVSRGRMITITVRFQPEKANVIGKK